MLNMPRSGIVVVKQGHNPRMKIQQIYTRRNVNFKALIVVVKQAHNPRIRTQLNYKRRNGQF